MPRGSWLFDKNATKEPTKATIAATETVICKLTELAQEREAASKFNVLEKAPGLYEGPLDRAAAEALTYEACATWLWAQLWGGPDRNALLETMAN